MGGGGGGGLTADFARLSTLLLTFITRYICLTKNKIWVFHPDGGGVGAGICSILLHPNTRNLLLLFYAPVSLNFTRCPNFRAQYTFTKNGE